MDRKCLGCGKEYWAKQRWMHERCATNTATNGEVIATNAKAVTGNPAEGIRPGRGDRSGDLRPDAGRVVGDEGSGKTKNRRTREAYNAYQRDYMRKKRACLK